MVSLTVSSPLQKKTIPYFTHRLRTASAGCEVTDDKNQRRIGTGAHIPQTLNLLSVSVYLSVCLSPRLSVSLSLSLSLSLYL